MERYLEPIIRLYIYRIEALELSRIFNHFLVKDVLLNFFIEEFKRKELIVRNYDKITALYERLSRDDGLQGERNSIINQKKNLENIGVPIINFFSSNLTDSKDVTIA